eukprot:TRINITY_DN19214_c0_g1_i1.p1 TRINITY_DN19214_c0_g1~~TRINITY_DN19214_c0_g1_i1.p1  ORF type:complete len:523 (+),score=116.89 TRINITY_DN19214_c0_g1_i1:29-1570(+)
MDDETISSLLNDEEWKTVPGCVHDAIVTLNNTVLDLREAVCQLGEVQHSQQSSPFKRRPLNQPPFHVRNEIPRTPSKKKTTRVEVARRLIEVHQTTKKLKDTIASLAGDEFADDSYTREEEDVLKDVLRKMLSLFSEAATQNHWLLANLTKRQELLHLGAPKHFYQNTKQSQGFQYTLNNNSDWRPPETALKLDSMLHERRARSATPRSRSTHSQPHSRPSRKASPSMNLSRHSSMQDRRSQEGTPRQPPTPVAEPPWARTPSHVSISRRSRNSTSREHLPPSALDMTPPAGRDRSPTPFQRTPSLESKRSKVSRQSSIKRTPSHVTQSSVSSVPTKKGKYERALEDSMQKSKRSSISDVPPFVTEDASSPDAHQSISRESRSSDFSPRDCATADTKSVCTPHKDKESSVRDSPVEVKARNTSAMLSDIASQQSFQSDNTTMRDRMNSMHSISGCVKDSPPPASLKDERTHDTEDSEIYDLLVSASKLTQQKRLYQYASDDSSSDDGTNTGVI